MPLVGVEEGVGVGWKPLLGAMEGRSGMDYWTRTNYGISLALGSTQATKSEAAARTQKSTMRGRQTGGHIKRPNRTTVYIFKANYIAIL